MRKRAALMAFLFIFGGGALLAGYFGLRPIPSDLPESAAKLESQKDAAFDPKDPLRGVKISPEGTVTESGVTIDIARISPDGSSVFAGRSEPNSYVTVYEGDKPVGSVKADGGGEWSLATEHRFASLDPKLAYKSTTEPPPEIAAAGAPATVASSGETPAAPAEQKSAAATTEPQAVTKELLKKFEGMVAEAREEAKQEREKATAAAKDANVTPSAGAGATSEKTSPATTTPATAPATTPLAASQDSATPRAETGIESATVPAPSSTPLAQPPGTAKDVPLSSATAREAATPSKKEKTRTAASADTTPQSSPAETAASIPVPIMFVYNESTFTEDGRKAADLLLEYLMLKHPVTVTLSGHADERGSDAYNMDLSRERLDAVERYLQAGGFTGTLNLIPKGKSEPFMGIDRTKYAGEALYQLDRRVELRLFR